MIKLNFCFKLVEVSEIEKTIIPMTPISIILKINKKFLLLYGSFPETAKVIRKIIKVIRTSGLKIVAIIGAILFVSEV